MKKLYTPLLLTLTVMLGGLNAWAQDKVIELTADMYFYWTGYDASAIRGEQATDVEFNVGNGVEVGAGGVVCGNGSVSNTLYADLTGSSKLIIEGTPGTPLRVMFNRQEDGSLVEKNPTIGEDGTVNVDLTDLPYVHLNTIKVSWGAPAGLINSIKYVMPDDPLQVPKEALNSQISTAKMYNSIAYTEESFDALQNSIKDGEEAMSAATTVEALQDAKTAIEDAITGLKFAEGYVELTKDMFLTYASVDEPGEGTKPGEGCAYDLFKSTGLAYGDGNVSELSWADLTDYDSFIVTVAQGEPRFCMNRLAAGGQQAATQEASKMVDINPNSGDLWSTEAYETISEDKTVYTIDLKKIVDGTEDLKGYGFARLHSIKGAHYGNVFVTGMYLYKEPATVEAGTTSVPVKMTYVNMDEPDKAYGEIAEGETAEAGYNKISGGTVGFGNTGWKVNYITYLQVNVSEIEGTILNATLSFDASGSTESKRNTGWGAGYNSSVWSSDMTYNTADKSITTVGEQAWTTSKSATTFDNLSIDITEAVKNADADGMVTILIYETNAGGGYIKNPVVEVKWTNETAYEVTFKETNDVEATITVNDQNVTNGTSLINGTYTFTATAVGYNDYEGSFTVDGDKLVVGFTMTPKAVWNYTVNAYDSEGNILGALSTGTGYEKDNVEYHYPEFYLVGTDLLSKANNVSSPYWGAKGYLGSDNAEFKVTYDSGTTSDVVFYKEAEEMEGFTSRDTNNAQIRCSNGLGGTVEGDVLLTTLPAGKYTIFGQVWGTTGLTAGVKIKAATEDSEDTNLWVLESTGSLTNSTSTEFELTEDTELYIYTTDGNHNRMLDLIYIKKTGEADTTGVKAIEAVKDGKWYNLQGIQVAEPTVKGLYIRDGKKVIVK